jgi:hypothetical protein
MTAYVPLDSRAANVVEVYQFVLLEFLSLLA